MALRLQIISRHRQGLGDRSTKEFGRDGGTIGRSLESDWVLPDGQRYISSRHASIDFRSGSYYIVDTSTNGVYVNDSEQPVGRGNPQRLFSGRSHPARRVRDQRSKSTSKKTRPAARGRQPRRSRRHGRSACRRRTRPAPTSSSRTRSRPSASRCCIQEEAQTAAIRSAAKLAAASLRLEDDPPPRSDGAAAAAACAPRRRRRRATSPRRAWLGRSRSPPAAPKHRARLARRKRRRHPRRNVAPPGSPSATRRSTRSSAAPVYAAQKLDDKQAEQTLHRLGQTDARDDPRLERESAPARRAEERAARPEHDDPAAEQQPAQVLRERRRGDRQPAVPPVVGVPAGRRRGARGVQRHQAAPTERAERVRAAHRRLRRAGSTPTSSRTSSRTASAAAS